jgi:hypothetical protein
MQLFRTSSRRGAVSGLALLLSLAGLAAPAAAQNIYRYEDASGRTVFNATIPPEYVSKGYTILNSRGQVVQVVPPAPTAEEIAARRAEEEARRKQMEADALLLRLYRSPEEIERKRDERLMQLDTQIAGLNVTLAKLEGEIAELDAVFERLAAAQLEPSAEELASLAAKQADRERFAAQREAAEREKLQVVADAERDSARLRELRAPR